jgi:DNA ligase 1
MKFSDTEACNLALQELFLCFEECEVTKSRNVKLTSLLVFRNRSTLHDELLRFVFDIVYNPYKTFGLTVPELSLSQLSKAEPLYMFTDFFKLQSSLVERELTGNEARQALFAFLHSSGSSLNFKWFSRIFSKDLKMGVAEGTINIVYPGLLPSFVLQKADKYEGEMYEGGLLSQPKLNGFRCLLVPIKGTLEVLSSNGRPLYNAGHIVDSVSTILKRQGVFGKYVPDGELMSRDWNSTASGARSSKTKVIDADSKFNMFDLIPIDEYLSQRFVTPQMDRLDNLLEIFAPKSLPRLIDDRFCLEHDPLTIVRGLIVHSAAEALERAKFHLSLGYEGSVVKSPMAPYANARGVYWKKIKFTETIDAAIVDVQEGQGRLKGSLGAFVIQLPSGQICNVGGGFSDQQRSTYWGSRDKLVGTFVEVKFQERTKDGSLLFPVFMRLRADK